MLVAIIDWSHHMRAKPGTDIIKKTFGPKVTGNRGGRKRLYAQMYHDGCLPPHYPVPALLEDSPELFHPRRLVDYDRIRVARISYSGY